MLLSSLPTVLLQLVCQQLDLASLLAFARCSHATLAAASAPVALSLVPPKSVCSAQPGFRGFSNRSLLRFCPRVTLIVLGAEAACEDESSRAARWNKHIGQLASLSTLYGLDILDRDPIPLNELISAAPVLRSLRVLHVASIEMADSSLASLPALTDVSLACELSSLCLHSLQHLPELRVLFLHALANADNPVAEADLSSLSHCTRLERLTLKWFHLPQLASVITSRMQHLESVTLIGLGVAPDLTSWARCLNAAPKLRSLSVYVARFTRALINAITTTADPHGPLRHVLMHPTAGYAPYDPTFAPGLAEATRSLMQRLPLLQRFELSLAQSRLSPSSDDNRGKYAERYLDLHLAWISKAFVDSRIAMHRAAFEAVAAEDPRVFIVEAPVMLSVREREQQLRARPKTRPHKSVSRCVVM